MIISLSVIELLDGTLRLNEKRREFQFEAMESSFFLDFKRIGKKKISITEKKSKKVIVDFEDFSKAVYRGSKKLLDEYIELIGKKGISVPDIQWRVKRLKIKLEI